MPLINTFIASDLGSEGWAVQEVLDGASKKERHNHEDLQQIVFNYDDWPQYLFPIAAAANHKFRDLKQHECIMFTV